MMASLTPWIALREDEMRKRAANDLNSAEVAG
jgi:hypothetical protein